MDSLGDWCGGGLTKQGPKREGRISPSGENGKSGVLLGKTGFPWLLERVQEEREWVQEAT